MAKAKTARNGDSTKKRAAVVVAVDGTTEVQREFHRVQGPATSGDLETEIRRRAYELYERRGRTPGHESEDWLVAEQEIAARPQGA